MTPAEGISKLQRENGRQVNTPCLSHLHVRQEKPALHWPAAAILIAMPCCCPGAARSKTSLKNDVGCVMRVCVPRCSKSVSCDQKTKHMSSLALTPPRVVLGGFHCHTVSQHCLASIARFATDRTTSPHAVGCGCRLHTTVLTTGIWRKFGTLLPRPVSTSYGAGVSTQMPRLMPDRNCQCI